LGVFQKNDNDGDDDNDGSDNDNKKKRVAKEFFVNKLLRAV